MAVSGRGYIFGAFLSSVLSAVLLIIAIATDRWAESQLLKGFTASYLLGNTLMTLLVGLYIYPSLNYAVCNTCSYIAIAINIIIRLNNYTSLYIICTLCASGISIFQMVVSTATATVQAQDSIVRYGLFSGEVILHNLATPSYNTLYMTCVPSINACAVSCKTEAEARRQEVTALANRFRPNQACVSVTIVDESNPLDQPAVISFGVYASVLAFIFLQLFLTVVAAGLAILNATKNPTEPLFGLPGCLYVNIATSVVGIVVILLFGIYWASSSWQEHLAFSYIALGLFAPGPGLGYSYWILIPALLCSIANVAVILLRQYLLERDPPPPTIKIDNHADGNIFLY